MRGTLRTGINFIHHYSSSITKPKPTIMPSNYLKTRSTSLSTNGNTQGSVSSIVKGVIDTIRSNGDSAVREYSEKFDKWTPKSFKLSKAEVDDIISKVPEQTIKDIEEVQGNVRAFAEAQRASLKDFEIEIRPGVKLGQKNNPIDSVGW